MSSPYSSRSAAARRRKRGRSDLTSRRRPRLDYLPGPDTAIVELVEFEITNEPIPDARYGGMPKREQDRLAGLHDRALDPAEAADTVPVLEDLIERYPDVPVLYNFLSNAYANSGQGDQATEMIERTYHRFPDYLFGVINYAWMLLQQGHVEDVTAVLDRRFGLHLWIRGRRTFHLSEFLSFNCLMVGYFTALGRDDVARIYLNMMREVAPDHTSTRTAAECLRPGLFRSKLRALNSDAPDFDDLRRVFSSFK